MRGKIKNYKEYTSTKIMKTNLLFISVFLLILSGKAIASGNNPDEKPGDTKTSKVATAPLPVFEFRATANNDELKSVSKEMIEEHFLGETIAEKLYLFESKYTYQVPIVPGNPQTRTVIRKPVVYEAVKKIERQLKKAVKKGEVSLEAAQSEFSKVLDVASNVLTANTTEFEKAIADSNDANALTNLFTNRVKLVF